MTISGRTNLYCVIGDPVEHSLSPFIMNRAFASHDVDAVYVAFQVTKDRAADAIRALRSLGFAGANVTYPLKEAAFSLADRRAPAAEVIGAANVLRFTRDGVEAHNTDALGTTRALEHFADTRVSHSRVFIFGGGGSGRAAAYGLLEAGADSITFGMRDAKKAAQVVERFDRAFPDRSIGWHDLTGGGQKTFSGVDIIINATPVGMAGCPERRLVDDDSAILKRHCCFDFVYHPRETELTKAARRRGARAVDGLALLVAQAQAGFHLWTGSDFSLSEMFHAAAAQLAAREVTEKP